jgi:hypothetical protein
MKDVRYDVTERVGRKGEGRSCVSRLGWTLDLFDFPRVFHLAMPRCPVHNKDSNCPRRGVLEVEGLGQNRRTLGPVRSC